MNGTVLLRSMIVLLVACGGGERSEPPPAQDELKVEARADEPAPAVPAAAPAPKPEPAAEAAPQPEATPGEGAERSPRSRAEPQPPSVDKKKEERAPAAAADLPAATPAPSAATSPSADHIACGDDDQPPCPLQGWMERNLQQPLDDGALARVATGLDRAAKLAPDPGWNGGAQGWTTLAEAGAAAARAGDRDALQKSCKGCHRAWRSKYKAAFRTRPVAD